MPFLLHKLLNSSSGSTSSTRAVAIGPSVLTIFESPKVDVVFIHGLTGHREKSWTAEGEVDPWPKSLLSKDLPTARIVTYGYDADVLHLTRPAGQNTIREHAKTLLNDLGGLRDDAVGRPIIFVAHSLGGLVIQDALLICNNPNDEAQSDILSSTRGVAFLGTPHAGANSERIATAVANIVHLVKKPNEKLLRVLNKNSEILANIVDGFHTMVLRRLKDPQRNLKPIELHTFIEEIPIDFLECLVVEPNSAKIPGYNFDTIPANHMDMTKFRTASDQGYIRVMKRLKRWVGDDLYDDNSIGFQCTERLRDLLKECSKSQPPDSAKQVCELPDTEESLKWFLESSEYQVWKLGRGAKLWVRGEHGDGKTVLISYILRTLSLDPRSGGQKDIASIFCSSEDSEVGMVAALVYQLLEKNTNRAKVVQQEFPIVKFQQHAEAGGLRNLAWDLLKCLVMANIDSEAVFIIDGIDKLDLHVRSSFLQRFLRIEKEARERDVLMRVLISSKADDGLEHALDHYSRIDREKERRECLNTLAFQEWNARERLVKDVEEGGGWLSSNDEYKQWSENCSPSTLWLEGKAASGKSTLTGIIVRELENRGTNSIHKQRDVPHNVPRRPERTWIFNSPKDSSTIVARFYYSFRGGSTETSYELMLRSIVYQIWSNNTRLFPLLRDRYRELLRKRDADVGNQKSIWTYNDLKLVLYSLNKVDFDLEVVIVVDGMDESDSDKRTDVLKFLFDLPTKSSHNCCIVKVLIASRPENDIRFRLKRPGAHHIQLQQVNGKDIEVVVDRWINRMELERSCGRGTFDEIKEHIINESSGVFLRVTLVLRDMEKCVTRGGYTKRDLKRRVSGLPKELGGKDGLYRLMVESLIQGCQAGEEERGKIIFAWVTFAERPLLVTELQDVLATPPQSEIADLPRYDLSNHRPEKLEEGLLSFCGGLVEARERQLDQIVQLIHQTAREFLLNRSHVAKLYHLNQVQGDTEIAITCCRYLQIAFTAIVPQMEPDPAFSHVNKLVHHLSDHGLLLYALENFSKHMKHLESNAQEIRVEFEDFIADLSQRPNSYACLLLSQWVETLDWPTQLHMNVDKTNALLCVRSVLSCATRRATTLQVLLVLRQDLLHLAIKSKAYVYTIHELLNAGANVNARDLAGQTALHISAGIPEQKGLIHALLEVGADINARDLAGQTALHILAAIPKQRKLIRTLLGSGVDVNARDLAGQTALHISAGTPEQRESVRALLGSGADVNARDLAGQTALHIAMENGHKKITELLLDSGAMEDTATAS